jgi:hypothetical protein
MDERLVPYLQDQAGVVSRAQALTAGLRPDQLARLVRRRELARLHRGVYLDHTGEPSWSQRAWAAVLACGPAALSHGSALRVVEGPGSRRHETPVELVVDHRRRPVAPSHGIVVHRSRNLEERVQWHLGPPRVRYDEAVIDVAARATSDLDALGELARAVQGRRTTAARLQLVVDARAWLPRRDWLGAVLDDVAAGACSVLEHGYLTRVERVHGLRVARRQVQDRIGAGTVYRDVEYAGGLVVELDGRLFHDSTAQRDRDLDRDLDAAAVSDKRSVRVGYGQVFDRACWTAVRIELLLRRVGWTGQSRPCSPDCTLGRI